MPHLHFAFDTPLRLDRVLAALTDFGPARAEAWPNIDSDHFELHDQGPGGTHVEVGVDARAGEGRSACLCMESVPPALC
jgi:hypothetical protein